MNAFHTRRTHSGTKADSIVFRTHNKSKHASFDQFALYVFCVTCVLGHYDGA